MKRYAKLSLFTLLGITIFILIGFFVQKEIPEVNVIELQKMTANNTISCSGKIEGKDAQKVNLTLPVVFKEVYASAGDKVKKGDIIAVVDKQQTLTSLVQLAQSYAAGDSLNVTAQVMQSGVFSLEKLMESIPDNIASPASGTITECNIEGNQFNNFNSHVIAVSDNSGLQIRIPVSETQISSIKKGQYAIISGAGFSGKYYGAVTSIAESARDEISTSGTKTVIDVIVTLLGEHNKIKPGLTANAKILTKSLTDVIIVPYSAVLQDENNQEFVYLYNGSSAVKQCIVTGKEYENGFEVLKGLSTGNKIITEPQKISEDGQKVSLIS